MKKVTFRISYAIATTTTTTNQKFSLGHAKQRNIVLISPERTYTLYSPAPSLHKLKNNQFIIVKLKSNYFNCFKYVVLLILGSRSCTAYICANSTKFHYVQSNVGRLPCAIVRLLGNKSYQYTKMLTYYSSIQCFGQTQ